MKKTRLLFYLLVLMNILWVNPSCMTEKEIYQSASGEKELPKWRILSRAREAYGPYTKWKEELIKQLYAGSKVIDTKKGPSA